MTRLLARLVLLISVLLMPFGMTGATAAAAHQAAAATPMQHCPDQGSKQSTQRFAECTMACSAALPVAAEINPDAALANCMPLAPAIAMALHGLHPETATPPPKRS
jgi:hypothetical protein